MRLIDADAFLAREIKRCHCVPSVGSSEKDYESLKLQLQQEPTVDAAPVVRCKDCQFCGKYLSGALYCKNEDGLLGTTPDAFCSLGVRKDGGNEL